MDKSIADLGWSQQQRLHFMERQLLWGRRLTLPMVQEAFDISRNQASRDIKLYRELAPDNVPEYKPAERCYRPSRSFKPLFAVADPRELLTVIDHPVQNALSLAAVPVLSRHILEGVLPAVLTALEYGVAFEAIYASASTPIGVKRVLVPRAIVYVDNRLHLRAWCDKRQEYRDFVLSRILSVPKLHTKGGVDLPVDEHWEAHVDVELIPNPALADDGQQLIRREYRLDAFSPVRVCAALVHYFLQVNLLPSSSEQLDQARSQPWSFPVVVKNWAALESHLFGAKEKK